MTFLHQKKSRSRSLSLSFSFSHTKMRQNCQLTNGLKLQACFKQWQLGSDSEKKTLFMEFMKKKLNLSQLDDSTFYTGIITPPAAMVAKRAGESVPQLKLIKSIPDVIFVPSATVLALISVKISRKMFLGQVAT